jgi:hypothetical protein
MAGFATLRRTSRAGLAANRRDVDTPGAHLRGRRSGAVCGPVGPGTCPTDLQHRRAGWHAGQLGRIARAGACRTTGEGIRTCAS